MLQKVLFVLPNTNLKDDGSNATFLKKSEDKGKGIEENKT